MAKDIIYGLHAVEAALSCHCDGALYLLQDRQDQRLEHIMQLAQRTSVCIHKTSRSQLDNLASNTHHQGVVFVGHGKQQISEKELPSLLNALQEPALLLILDGIQDPHNLGACLRVANAAGVHAVIAPKDRAVGITSVVRKVASGAVESTPFIRVTNLARTLRLLKEQNIWIYGADMVDETPFFQADFTTSIALVLGSEGKGLRRLTREHCDALIHIPMSGTVSSLNISVAAGICLFETIRQRIK